ncbi:helix-turn-helix domain-containing protein [PVC group bacterium]|nr:helix-turn-helix domain-containing protein [PVC group bacterium]
MEKRYISSQELSDFIGVKPQTLRKWVCYRKIPFFKVGRMVKFDLREIEKWMEKKRRKALY